MLHTTFRLARNTGACVSSYRKFAKFKGGVKKWGLNTPIPLNEVLEVCGFSDALWCLQIVTEVVDKEIRLFACDCAEHVLSIYESKYPDDKRPRNAIEISRKFAIGEVTRATLHAAWAAARSATWAANDAAWDAARAAAWAANDAAWAAAAAAARAANDAARAAERQWQCNRFLELLAKDYSDDKGRN